MTACPYCQLDLDESVCSHWVATLSDDSDGYDTLTPLYFGWTEHCSESQDVMIGSFNSYFEALCLLCDQVAQKGVDQRAEFLKSDRWRTADDATLREAIELLDRTEIEGSYENARDLLQSEFGAQMKELFNDFCIRCGGEVIDYRIDHSPGLSWSGTHYCAENAKECVSSITAKCEEATGRIREL